MEIDKNSVYKKQKDEHRLDDSGLFPKVVLIDTVSYCNLKCSMCVHNKMTRKKGVIPWSLFTKIIDEISVEDRNVRVWMVFFGDPFIIKKTKPSIFDMIAYAKEKGLTDVVINSNGNLMDAEAARQVIESGLDAIYFGVDACSPETYAQLRVGGDYKKTVANIEYLLELKEKTGAAKPAVFIQFVEMEKNVNEKDKFVEFWISRKVTIKIRPMVSWAGSIEAPNLVLGNEGRWPCHWAMQTMSITDQGKVVTCAVDLDARFVAGDVNKNTIKEIWNGKLKELRNLHEAGRYEELPPNCRDCRDWQSARSDYYEVNS